MPVTDGFTHAHVLRALGIDPELPPEGVAACVGRVGIGFAHQKVVAPALWALLPLRRAVGKRTFLNTVEPLANPGRAAVHVGSCFHLPYASRVCEALARCRAADWPPTARAVVFQGVEGADELRPGQARLAELRGEEVATATVDARAAGVAFDLRDLALPGGDAAASARWTEALLTEGDAAAAGAPPAAAGAFREAVLWSAAVRIYAAGRAPDLAAALRPAREALASGEAGRVLAAWRAAAPLAAAGAWAAGRSASPA
ncbi:MAG: hypothetical protein IRY95_02895 [Clostridia bacterium]|nr:hypothetical protein [Clostridia bacterium]